MQSQKTIPTEELIDLLEQLEMLQASLANVKQKAMELVRNGADPMSRSRTWPQQKTLLHFLVMYNDDNEHDQEIEELLKAHSHLVNITNGSGDTPLKTLLDINKVITFKHFKHSAMQLARKGANLTVKDFREGNTLLHVLVNNNQEGKNDKEIIELLKINAELARITNKKNNTPFQDQGMDELFKIALRKTRFFQAPEERSKVHQSAEQGKHAENREELILLLQNYIARIEDHEKPDKDKSVDFGWSFLLFKEQQATNREANYNLARDLLDALENNSKVDIKKLFSEENIESMRSKYVTAGFWGGKIHSSELNSIISDAREMATRKVTTGHQKI